MQDIWVLYFIDPDLEIITDSDGAVTSIFFQDGHMKKFFSLYPELLMLDATYKLTNVRMPLYVMLCVGPNGESEIVAVFLTVREDAPTLCEALDRFKSRNPHWNNICTVMTDKDLAEREAVKQKFPQVALMLCLFHVLRAMSREVTTSKMSITEEQRGRALQALQGLAYAKSDEEYNSLRESFRTSMPQTVVQYYEANWHTCRHEWVLCWQRQNVTFGERTNNRLESVNKRLKAVIKSGSSLPNFFKDLIAMLACMRMERHHTILSVTDKVSVKHYPVGSAQSKFSAALTPFACSLVLKQLKLAEDGPPLGDVTAHDRCCSYSETIGLPCHHMLAIRMQAKESVFTLQGIWPRWLKADMLSHRQLFNTADADTTAVTITQQKVRPLTLNEKFQRCKRLGQTVIGLVCEGGSEQFHSRIAVLNRLIRVWQKEGIAIIKHADCEDENEEVQA